MEVLWEYVCHHTDETLLMNLPGQKEFERWKNTCESEEVKLPTKRDLDHKYAQLRKLPSQPITEVSISAQEICLFAYVNTEPRLIE